MEKIYFDDTTFIWKTKLNLSTEKEALLKQAHSIIDATPRSKTDSFSYKKAWQANLDFIGNIEIEKKLDEIVQISINESKKLYEEKNIIYNKINIDFWINQIRSKNPIQENFHNKNDKYHTHTEISKKSGIFIPHYACVYYIQMPEVMENEDGVLYFKGKNGNEYWIRPEEDELIIMEADMPHSPNNAPNSNLDRIVLAGNVGFDYIKKEKSVI
jgi:hypothetical protein